MTDVNVQAIKGFNADGLNLDVAYVKRGAKFTVDELVARDLHRNGLIEDYEMKSASTPENKKAPEPTNKSAQKPATKPAEKPKV